MRKEEKLAKMEILLLDDVAGPWEGEQGNAGWERPWGR